MICPSCSKTLEKVTARGIEVDVCAQGCGGIWFDQKELDAFDSSAESAGAEALLSLRIAIPPPPPSTAPRPCPRCVKYKMQKNFSCVKRAVEIDTCPGCGGTWLDPGELIRIQATWKTDQERAEAVENFFTYDVMPIFEAERARLRDSSTLLKTEKVLRFARFSELLKIFR